jgi:hypothetical protein
MICCSGFGFEHAPITAAINITARKTLSFIVVRPLSG